MLRGGSWNNNNTDNLRAGNRNRNNPDNNRNNNGFRWRPTLSRAVSCMFTDLQAAQECRMFPPNVALCGTGKYRRAPPV